MYKSQTLDNIRQNIDKIDDTIHDLLMERAALASSIAAEKRKRGMPVVHPAREAKMIRRLLSRHKGDLPKQAVTRIWRELVSAVSMLQSGLTARFYSHDGRSDDLKIVTDYFGSILPVERGESVESVIRAVVNKDTDFAILPYAAGKTSKDHWLPPLLNALENDVPENDDMPVSIVQSMPFIRNRDEQYCRDDRYLIMARTYFDTSGDDYSFIALKSSVGFDDVYITDSVEKAGLSVEEETQIKEGKEFYLLLRVDGFVDANVESIKKLRDLLNDELSVYAIGGYPKTIYV